MESTPQINNEDGTAETSTSAGLVPGSLPFSTLFAYSMPSLVLGFSSALVGLYILKFATDVLLIAPGLFATMYATARVWDGISDPIAGYLSDRTTMKAGRRRPWIALGSVPLAVSVIVLWSPPASLEGGWAVAWIGVAIVFFYTSYTVVAVPHLALGAEMTTDYHERSKVFGGRGMLEFSGVLIAALVIWLFQTAEDPRATARFVAWIFAGLAIPILCLSVTRIVERPDYLGRGAHSPIAAFRDIWRNRYARILITVFFLENLSLSFLATLFPFMTQYLIPGETTLTGVYLAMALAVTLISFPFWFPLSRRFGKRNIWLAANVLKLVGFVSIFFVSSKIQWPGYLAIVLIGASLSAHVILAPSVKADVVDYDEYATGERKEGAYFAIWNLVLKLGGAVAVALGGVLLEVSKYEANVEQTPEALLMMRSLFAGVPAVLHAIVIVLLLRFDLNQREHAAIRAAIDERIGSE